MILILNLSTSAYQKKENVFPPFALLGVRTYKAIVSQVNFIFEVLWRRFQCFNLL